ncbi:YbaB/EbfC family nucleoid-associated protein [Actinomadura sp. 6N118]|uniref:YbaB/EbfC family nucleoid-associated protein n=1 Tax=Actinomadura sp. 6N118 TaxID=3375151 RepID=UPI003796E66F
MTVRDGSVVDIWKLRDDLRTIRERADTVQATAESEDGLVSATVGSRGRLLRLDLDVRIFRVPDSRALAETIRETLGRAREQAGEDLAALAAEVFATPPPAGRPPRPDPLPSEDRELTRSVLHLREGMAAVRSVAESPDGLIHVAVDERGSLTELRLDPRVYRDTDPRSLAEAITEALRQAEERIQEQFFELLKPFLPARVRREETDLGFDPLIHQLDRTLERGRHHV